MLYFRLTLSKFERKSLLKALSQAQKLGQLTVRAITIINGQTFRINKGCNVKPVGPSLIR